MRRAKRQNRAVSWIIPLIALLLSAGSLSWQVVTAYRRRRRLLVEIAPIFHTGREPMTWVRVHVAAVGGTYSTRSLTIQFGKAPVAGSTAGQPDLGRQGVQEDTRPLLEQISDPMHERRTIHDGEQLSWIRRVTGGSEVGIENEGGWVQADVELADARHIYSDWMWLQQDSPGPVTTVRPPRPKRNGQGLPEGLAPPGLLVRLHARRRSR